MREATIEVSLCETLPASESIVAALADVREPTHDVSLHELSVASPGVANDVLAEPQAAPALPRGRSKRWLWGASALPLLLAAAFFALESRPPEEPAVAVLAAPDPSVSAAAEPAPPSAAQASDALPATQPSADVSDDTSGEQAAAETLGHEQRAEPDAADPATLARADELTAQGSALRMRRMLGPARNKYRAALQINPGHPRALYGLAQLALQQRDGKQAVQLALELVQAQPEQASYSLLLGDAYRAAGKRKEAREAWQNAARQGNALARKRLK